MGIIIKEGNLLDAKENLILHQVNCKGKMNSGVAKAIREKWEKVFVEYTDVIRNNFVNPSSHLLGETQYVYIDSNKYVVNLFTQDNFGYDGERYTSYDALYVALRQVSNFARRNNYTVALPYRIGSDRGGANWNIVYKIIEEVFKNLPQDVVIYKLEGVN